MTAHPTIAPASKYLDSSCLPLANQRPLVSFCLFAYNQEEFIRAAVEGALAQDYAPLEIILSDDCSTDRTFEIMQEMAATYHGGHRIILNRNERNLGLAAHINRVAALAQGAWLVAAAGDDISMRERVSRLMAAALQNPDAYGLLSAWDVIDESGKKMRVGQNNLAEKNLACLNAVSMEVCLKVRGAVAAWRKELYTWFAPLRPDLWREDVVLGFRALIGGSILVLPEVLVQYRSHNKSISAGNVSGKQEFWAQVRDQEERNAHWAGMLHVCCCQIRDDLNALDPRLEKGSLDERKAWKQAVLAQLWTSGCQSEWWRMSWRRRLQNLLRAMFGNKYERKMSLWMLVRCCGLAVFVAYRTIGHYCKQCFRVRKTVGSANVLPNT